MAAIDRERPLIQISECIGRSAVGDHIGCVRVTGRTHILIGNYAADIGAAPVSPWRRDNRTIVMWSHRTIRGYTIAAV
jgi:hypothetical protein